jgi:hypothetical protein
MLRSKGERMCGLISPTQYIALLSGEPNLIETS